MLHLFWLLLLLTSCSYTYIPLIPSKQTKESRLELHTSKGLSTENERLQLSLFLYEVPQEAWLAVQWFEPLGNEVASASKWVTPESVGEELIFVLPEDIEMKYGTWRTIASFQGELIRQFSLEVKEPSSEVTVEEGFQEEEIITE